MAGRSPLRSVSPHDPDHASDLFSDRPSAPQFQEPQPGPSDLTLPLPQEYGSQGRPYDEDETGKQPLTGSNVLGVCYPPLYVYYFCPSIPTLTLIRVSPGPDAYGDPYARLPFATSSASTDVETAWRHRQTIQHGVKKAVKLTNGNFITEYPVPTSVYSAVEDKWRNGVRTTEFS
jgi:chitin synthase